MGLEGMDRIYRAQDKDKWEALVNMQMKFHGMWGILCLTEDVLASQEGLWSMELVGLEETPHKS